jgi:hypothetical protein
MSRSPRSSSVFSSRCRSGGAMSRHSGRFAANRGRSQIHPGVRMGIGPNYARESDPYTDEYFGFGDPFWDGDFGRGTEPVRLRDRPINRMWNEQSGRPFAPPGNRLLVRKTCARCEIQVVRRIPDGTMPWPVQLNGSPPHGACAFNAGGPGSNASITSAAATCVNPAAIEQ